MTAPIPVWPGATGPIWRDREGSPWEELPDGQLRNVAQLAPGTRSPGKPWPRSSAEELWGPLVRDPDAKPEPHVWGLPPEPGPEVTKVRTATGSLYLRTAGGWRYEGQPPGSNSDGWDFLIRHASPLTDATHELTD